MSVKRSIFLGFDLGSNTVVTARSDAVLDPFSVSVDANALSNRSTPAIVGFENNRVLLGEDAETRLTSVPHKMVHEFFRNGDPNTVHGPFGVAGKESEEIHVENCLLLSLFYRNYISQVHGGSEIQFVTFSVPVNTPPDQIATVHYAAELAGLKPENFAVIDHIDAGFTLLQKYHGDASHNPFTVTFLVDCGFSHTSVGVSRNGQIIGKSNLGFGVKNLVFALADLSFGNNACMEKIAGNTSPPRLYFRLFKVFEKALKDLSMLPATVVDLTDFEDAVIDHGVVKSGWKPVVSLTRELFESHITASHILDKLHKLITDVIDQSDLANTRVKLELVGGGSRVPMIAKFFCTVLGVDDAGRSIDGSAFAALGAALYSAGKRNLSPNQDTLKSTTNKHMKNLSLLVELQTRIESAHAMEVARLAQKNALEAFLFNANRLIDDPGFAKYAGGNIKEEIKSAWTWFDEQSDSDSIGRSDGAEFKQKLEQLESLMQSEAAAYFAEIAEAKRRTEIDLEKSAHGNIREKNDSRDSRDAALSKDQALRLALKNKDEGNELFKHGTPLDAMNRYMRAVNMLVSRKNEFTPEDQAQANPILLACNLNIAQCVIRMTGSKSDLSQDEITGLLKRGVACADSALAIDPKNAKASYRKAMCLSRMKDPEQAKKVVDAALAETPLDEDLRKLYDSLVKTLSEQKSKAKQFFSKMFQ